MTPEEYDHLKKTMAEQAETFRDEYTRFIIEMDGKRYNLYDGCLTEKPSPMGYFSSEAFLCDLEEVLKKNKAERHLGFAIILKVEE